MSEIHNLPSFALPFVCFPGGFGSLKGQAEVGRGAGANVTLRPSGAVTDAWLCPSEPLPALPQNEDPGRRLPGQMGLQAGGRPRDGSRGSAGLASPSVPGQVAPAAAGRPPCLPSSPLLGLKLRRYLAFCLPRLPVCLSTHQAKYEGRGLCCSLWSTLSQRPSGPTGVLMVAAVCSRLTACGAAPHLMFPKTRRARA